ncbi:MAG: hypothetical protein D6780_03020 [Candidatus Dadabacteria bacterium]|nr:MAG: hypothetical protein D6780_03020 [Candidatus Dadabacteria bacterium]
MKKIIKKIFSVSPLILIILFLVEPAFAESEHHFNLWSLVPYWINFLIFVFFIVWIFRRRFPTHWKNRREEILRKIEEGEKVLTSAKKRYKEALAYRENLPKTLETIEKKIKEEGLAEKDALLRQAEEKARSIVESAKEAVEVERRLALAQIKEELVTALVKNLEERVKKDFTPEKDRELINKRCQQLGELLNR